MTLQPIKDVSEYRRLKQTLRDSFDNERTGDQNLFEEQTKKYKPLLTSQQEISKSACMFRLFASIVIIKCMMCFRFFSRFSTFLMFLCF